jgi:hypothetical protein
VTAAKSRTESGALQNPEPVRVMLAAFVRLCPSCPFPAGMDSRDVVCCKKTTLFCPLLQKTQKILASQIAAL